MNDGLSLDRRWQRFSAGLKEVQKRARRYVTPGSISVFEALMRETDDHIKAEKERIPAPF